MSTCTEPASVQGARDRKMKRFIPFSGGPVDLVGEACQWKTEMVVAVPAQSVQQKHKGCQAGSLPGRGKLELGSERGGIGQMARRREGTLADREAYAKSGWYKGEWSTQKSQVIFHSWSWNAGGWVRVWRGVRMGVGKWQEAGEKGQGQITKPYLCFAKDLEIYHKGQCFSQWVICVLVDTW